MDCPRCRKSVDEVKPELNFCQCSSKELVEYYEHSLELVRKNLDGAIEQGHRLRNLLLKSYRFDGEVAGEEPTLTPWHMLSIDFALYEISSLTPEGKVDQVKLDELLKKTGARREYALSDNETSVLESIDWWTPPERIK